VAVSAFYRRMIFRAGNRIVFRLPSNLWLGHVHLIVNSSLVFVLTVKLQLVGSFPGCFIRVFFVTYVFVAVQESLVLATFIG
jgi:hypothetical protein